MFSSRSIPHKMYLNSSKEDMVYEWVEELELPENSLAMYEFYYALNEVEFDTMIDPCTGHVWITAVNGVDLKEPVRG